MTRPPAASADPGSAWRDRVALPGRPTDLLVGEGTLRSLRAEVRARFPRARRAALVVDATVARLWPVGDAFSGEGPETVVLAVAPGEAAKTRDELARLQDALLPLTREEPVVAVGGGATTDVVGFAAATVKRGLPWIAVPTTVVGMADAALGGKVGINHPRGKNLLGTFHPPVLVLSDVAFLSTLPDRDRVAGLAELYKAGRVGDPDLLARLRRGAPADAYGWVEAIGRAAAVKARLVEADERDEGPRKALNYGHTVGHALETLLGNDAIRHGEAVAIGMSAAARIAVGRGLLPPAEETRQRDALRGLGLPADLPAAVAPERVLEGIALDKKRRPGERHAFVLPTGPSGVTVADDVTDDEVLAALAPPRP